MAGKKQFSQDPFWNYSLAIYGKAGVADACIYLQDEFRLDVNVLLACLWYAAEGPGRLESEQIRDVLNRTRDWQEKVVQPLRTVRRYCKDEPASVSGALRQVFRPELQAVELDAEHVEQLVISEALRLFAERASVAADVSSGNAGDDAIRNLQAYLALQGVSIDDPVAQKLGLIINAAFPGTDLGMLE